MLTGNLLIDTLSQDERQLLAEISSPRLISHHERLIRAGARVGAVHFIVSGLVSEVAHLRHGECLDVALLGHEGMVGSEIACGVGDALGTNIVRMSGFALRMAFLATSDTLRALVLGFNQFF